MLSEYGELASAGRKAPLDGPKQRRLETLQDVVLGASAIDESERTKREPRPPRAPVAVEVRFKSRDDAGRAQTLNVGPGGIAIRTAHPLPPGSALLLQIEVPGWRGPILTEGLVAWASADGMGISLGSLRPEDACRLKELVVESASLVTRLKAAFSGRTPAPASVAGGVAVLVCLTDDHLVDVTAELLGLEGFATFDQPSAGQRFDLVITDPEGLLKATDAAPDRPMVVVGASGPQAIPGKFTSRSPVAWIPKPASAARIVDATRRMLASVPGSALGRAGAH